MSNNLRVFRKRAKLSQQALAEAIGVTQQLICYIETGNARPSIETALKIRDYFKSIEVDCTLDDLFGGEPIEEVLER